MEITPKLMAYAEEIQNEKDVFIKDDRFENLTYDALNTMYMMLKLAQLQMQINELTNKLGTIR